MTHFDELLSVFLDGEATPAESKRIHSHLGECIRCRRTLSELNEARAALRSLPMLEMPFALLPTETDDVPRRRRRSAWLGVAAAAAAVTVLVATVLTPPPQPIPMSDISRQYGARAALDAGAAPLKLVVPAGVNE